MNNIKLSSFMLVAGLLAGHVSTCQDKRIIDTGMLDSWPRINSRSVLVSGDGHYVAYVVNNQPVGKNTLVLRYLRDKLRKREYVSRRSATLFFSSDSKQLCWQSGDSVFLLPTNDRKAIKFLGLKSTVSYPAAAKGEWMIAGVQTAGLRLVNLLTGKEKLFADAIRSEWSPCGRYLILNGKEEAGTREIRLVSPATGKEQAFSAVRSHRWSADGSVLALVHDTTGVQGIQWCFPAKGISSSIWTGTADQAVGNMVFDKASQQLAFSVKEKKNNKESTVSIWQYAIGIGQSKLRLNNSTVGIPAGLSVGEPRSFSESGRWLYMTLRKALPSMPREQNVVPVDIWSYRDEVLNPAQSTNLAAHKEYTAVLPIAGGPLRMLEEDGVHLTVLPNNKDQVLLLSGGHSGPGPWWPHGSPAAVSLLSLNDGIKRFLQSDEGNESLFFYISPNGRWICYWDAKEGNYYSLDPATGQVVNLTGRLPVSMASETAQTDKLSAVGIAGWYGEDSAMLVYDNYDIWRLDLSGRKSPVNLTGSYGLQHQVRLRLVEPVDILRGNEELLLTGYNRQTGENGFLRLRLNRPGRPELLVMSPHTYYMVPSQKEHGYTFNDGMRPVAGGKGKDLRWVVLRHSAIDYPNLYMTTDMKSFSPLTDLQPQKDYNWLTTERISWKMPNGIENQGVLYKPENFDPTKKYPVLFNYYEKFSHRLNMFPLPDLTSENINIPWFVSRGYLVCTPDIQYTVAAREGGYTTGEAAALAVESAARYLAKRAYIDSSRMGLQGQSFGGWETNMIITKTNLFAAAAEMAGGADAFSSYLTLVGKGGKEYMHKQDHAQGRVGATPWERPDLYRRNSPVLNADKVTTPLLIVHNYKDAAINFRQGVEMYMALRRLSKSCWLLQYDNSSHVLDTKADALDYTLRLTQYFDHYLKGKPPPRWMTGNNFAPYKGLSNLYELDMQGSCGKQCRVCNGVK